jgi:uncharacterized membrane protein
MPSFTNLANIITIVVQGIALLLTALIGYFILTFVYAEATHRISKIKEMSKKNEDIKNILKEAGLGLLIVLLGLVPVAMFLLIVSTAGHNLVLGGVESLLSTLLTQTLPAVK